MHDLACKIRPGDQSARAPVAALGGIGVPRPDPFPPMVEDWQRLLPFFQTVAAGATETAFSELITGDFRIDWVLTTVTAQNIPNEQLTIGAEYSDATGGVSLEIGSRVNPAGFGDNGANPTSHVVTLTPVVVPIGTIIRSGATRVVYAFRNATGGSVSIFGQLHITHLRRLDPHHALQ